MIDSKKMMILACLLKTLPVLPMLLKSKFSRILDLVLSTMLGKATTHVFLLMDKRVVGKVTLLLGMIRI